LNDIEFLKNLRAEIVLDTVSISSRILIYHKINNDIEKTIKLLDTVTELTAN